MPKYDLEWAIGKLSQLDPEQKINTMLVTAAIITKLLEKEQIRPIIVGGFSLAIYSNENYTTRDIDIVVNERSETALKIFCCIPVGIVIKVIRRWLSQPMMTMMKMTATEALTPCLPETEAAFIPKGRPSQSKTP